MISTRKYNILKKDYDEYVFKNSNLLDSLERDNVLKLESISNLEFEIDILNSKLDSLNHIKNQIISNRNGFTVSNSISNSAFILKKNLDEKNNDNTDI